MIVVARLSGRSTAGGSGGVVVVGTPDVVGRGEVVVLAVLDTPPTGFGRVDVFDVVPEP